MTTYRKRPLYDKDGAVIIPTLPDGKVFGEKILIYDMNDSNLDFDYSTGIQFPTTSNSNVVRTGLPDLTQYIGKIVRVYVRYGTTGGIFVGQTSVGERVPIQILTGYNDSRDLWFPFLTVENMTSTSWTLRYHNSFILLNTKAISQDTAVRTFNIVKVEIE